MKSLVLGILVCFSRPSSAQTTPEGGSFKMTHPKGWHTRTSDEIMDNLDRITLTPEQRTKFIASHNGSILVRSYRKYLPSEHPGPIPTVDVVMRASSTRDPQAFLAQMDQKARAMGTNLDDFAFVDEPRLVKVDGRDAVTFRATFKMAGPTGRKEDVRSIMYVILVGDTIYQLNMSDTSRDDCSGVYTDMIKSIDLD